MACGKILFGYSLERRNIFPVIKEEEVFIYWVYIDTLGPVKCPIEYQTDDEGLLKYSKIAP